MLSNSDSDTRKDIEKPGVLYKSIFLTIGSNSKESNLETAYLLGEQKKISYTQPLHRPPLSGNQAYQEKVKKRRRKKIVPGKRRSQLSNLGDNYDSELVCSLPSVPKRPLGNRVYQEKVKKRRGKKRVPRKGRRQPSNFGDNYDSKLVYSSGAPGKILCTTPSVPKFSCFGAQFYREEKSTLKETSLEEQYRNIVNLIVVDGYRCVSDNKKEKVIDVVKEEEMLLDLIKIGEDTDVTADEITMELIRIATTLRRMTVEAAETARASWKNYCLSFFCCASSPVQYNQLRLYILIDKALKSAQQQNLIGKINLEQLSDLAINRPLLRFSLF